MPARSGDDLTKPENAAQACETAGRSRRTGRARTDRSEYASANANFPCSIGATRDQIQPARIGIDDAGARQSSRPSEGNGCAQMASTTRQARIEHEEDHEPEREAASSERTSTSIPRASSVSRPMTSLSERDDRSAATRPGRPAGSPRATSSTMSPSIGRRSTERHSRFGGAQSYSQTFRHTLSATEMAILDSRHPAKHLRRLDAVGADRRQDRADQRRDAADQRAPPQAHPPGRRTC